MSGDAGAESVRIGKAAPFWMLATVAAMACVGLWMPCDSVAVSQGLALPQHLLWGALAIVGSWLAWPACHWVIPSAASRDRVAWERFHAMGGYRCPQWLWILLAMWLWIFGVIASIQNVDGRGQMRSAIHGGWESITLVWVAFAGMLAARFRMQRDALAWTMMLSCVLLANHAWYQYGVSMPRDREAYRVNPEAVLRQMQIDAPAGSALRIQFENRLASTEPLGPFALTNSLAATLAIGTLLALGLAVDQALQRSGRWITVVCCLCGIQAFCLLLTKSRTGWIAVLLAMIGYGLTHPVTRCWAKAHWKSLSVGFSAALLGLFILLSNIDGLVIAEAPKSLSFRKIYWDTSVRLIADHPWLGVGPGNFQSYYAWRKPIGASETIADPHQAILETAAWHGIPMAILLLIVLAAWLLHIVRRARLQAVWHQFQASHPHHGSAISSLVAAQHDEDLSGRSGLGGTRTLSGATPGSSWALQPPAPSGGRVSRAETASEGGRVWKWKVLAFAWGASALAVWLLPGWLGPATDLLPYLWGMPLGIALTWWMDRRDDQPNVHWFSSHSLAWSAFAGWLHLMANGGWFTPGVAHLLILVSTLAASSLVVPTGTAVPDSLQLEGHPLLRIGTRIGFLSLVLLLWFSDWRPSMALLSWKMQSPPTLEAMERGAVLAVQEDPWDPMPRQVLAQSIWQQITAQAAQGNAVSPRQLEEYQQACQQWLASDPASWQPRIDLGHQALELAGLIPEGPFGAQALKHYQAAIERYPNEVAVHLQTAMAATLLGDLELANASLKQAESLDSSTEHRDRRLKAALVYLPKSWDSSISSRMGAPFVRPNPGSPWVLGEPAATLIRSMLERLVAPGSTTSQELQPATNS